LQLNVSVTVMLKKSYTSYKLQVKNVGSAPTTKRTQVHYTVAFVCQ